MHVVMSWHMHSGSCLPRAEHLIIAQCRRSGEIDHGELNTSFRRIGVETKNYKSNVTKPEIEKFYRDIDINNDINSISIIETYELIGTCNNELSLVFYVFLYGIINCKENRSIKFIITRVHCKNSF